MSDNVDTKSYNVDDCLDVGLYSHSIDVALAENDWAKIRVGDRARVGIGRSVVNHVLRSFVVGYACSSLKRGEWASLEVENDASLFVSPMLFVIQNRKLSSREAFELVMAIGDKFAERIRLERTDEIGALFSLPDADSPFDAVVL